MVTRSYPTDHALAPSRVVVVGAGGPPSPTDLSAGDKCVPLVVHAAFNVVVYLIQETVLPYKALMEIGCDCTHDHGICYLAAELDALNDTITDELIPMTRLKCLPCTDLFAPFELVVERLEDVVLRSTCTSNFNQTKSGAWKCKASHCTGPTCPTCCGVDGPPVDNSRPYQNSSVCPEIAPSCTSYKGGSQYGICTKCGEHFGQLLDLLETVTAIVFAFVANTTCAG